MPRSLPFNLTYFHLKTRFTTSILKCFIVFDVTRASTFEAVVRWKNDLDSKVTLPDGSRIPCVLLANKVSRVHFTLSNGF